MGVAEHTMSRLAEGQAAERRFVSEVTRRYDRAVVAAGKAREALEAAERDRIAVLSEWAGAPGWSAERIADCAGLPAREVSEAVRAAASTASRPTERRRDMRASAAETASRAITGGERCQPQTSLATADQATTHSA